MYLREHPVQERTRAPPGSTAAVDSKKIHPYITFPSTAHDGRSAAALPHRCTSLRNSPCIPLLPSRLVMSLPLFLYVLASLCFSDGALLQLPPQSRLHLLPLPLPFSTSFSIQLSMNGGAQAPYPDHALHAVRHTTPTSSRTSDYPTRRSPDPFLDDGEPVETESCRRRFELPARAEPLDFPSALSTEPRPSPTTVAEPDHFSYAPSWASVSGQPTHLDERV